jgi:hypothetical protein
MTQEMKFALDQRCPGTDVPPGRLQAEGTIVIGSGAGSNRARRFFRMCNGREGCHVVFSTCMRAPIEGRRAGRSGPDSAQIALTSPNACIRRSGNSSHADFERGFAVAGEAIRPSTPRFVPGLRAASVMLRRTFHKPLN